MREEKRCEIIHDALNFLDDELVEDVEKLRGFVEKEETEQSSNIKKQLFFLKNAAHTTNKKRYGRRFAALAASVCVLIAGTWIFENYVKPSEDSQEEMESVNEESFEKWEEQMESSSTILSQLWFENEEAESRPYDLGQDSLEQKNDMEDGMNIAETPLHDMQSGSEQQGIAESAENARGGVTIPEMEVNLQKSNDGVEMDMNGLFIHDGRCYVQYRNCEREEADFVGDYVGKVNGLIDEWTEEDGYVNGAGTFEGNIYEVEGVSPEFMLCTIWGDGSVETFIQNNGITLYKGSDLVDDRLHLRENVKTVSFQTDEEWNETMDEPKILSGEYDALFAQFLDSFAENEFAYVEGKSYYPFGGDLDNSDIYHLYFTIENGITVRFALLGDGYVSFPWINGVCVQIDQAVYDEVVDVLNKN